ncbi:hypothetical protein AYO49_05230 [Verrucomicrobiaceae bacterium SCGC AG-212-N21]|nr:hypothetical protein AYO49_05230 [Verrucomicrobiaceae bacterium SCGC AG-212-N21]
MIRNITIDASRITGWDSFHDVFAETFGFPEFYGRNMDAWIDCMTGLDDAPGEAITKFTARVGDIVVICISSADQLKNQQSEIWDALVECTAFVNYRRIERDYPAILALSFYV